MYTAKVEAQFNSAHNLRGYKGKCEALHGHNWRVEVAAQSKTVDNMGMVVDFKELKNSLKGVLSDLDHKYLNELEYFKKVNPTSENIAKYIFEMISQKNTELNLRAVTVWETDTSAATYSE